MSDVAETRRSPATTTGTNTVMTHRMILFVIFGLMAGMFLSALDQTVVGTSIRTIGDDLQGLSLQAWVTTAYLIVSTISTPIYGKLSDIFGRRPLFLIAIVIFVVGSILASFSTSMIELAAFRAIQGLGAGGLMSMPLAIMGDILAPRERARYQGYFLAVFGISSVIGPLVGGLFAGADQILWITGWRWVFLINVPIGVAALAIVWRFLHIPKHPPASVRIDWWGATTVIVALVPLLLVAEQGREWGWGSPLAIGCYVIGAAGILAFVIVETLMKDDALIPLKLFRSPTFSMATVIGVLVGFGMFGAMLTLPLYLQLVLGSTPTESGFQMLPMILGLMIASIGSGQLIARTGRYRIFPTLGTLLMATGFFLLTFMTYDVSYWYVAGAMLVIGLGLGQLMQTLTIASQNSVGLRDMGVATSSSTFFRQIGGTLGTAVLLSLLFTLMPTNIVGSFSDRGTLTDALDAAFDPTVASAPANAKIMSTVYTPIVDQATDAVTAQVQSGVQQATEAATQGVAAQVAAGTIPAAAQQAATEAAVSQAIAAASTQIQQQVPVARVATDGTVSLDFSNAADREAFVDSLADTLEQQFTSGDDTASLGDSTLDDTSFLNGADARLSKPFLVGFNASSVSVYWVAMFVVLLAFVLSLFFRAPPLRAKSALQEASDERKAKEEEELRGEEAAVTTGSLITRDRRRARCRSGPGRMNHVIALPTSETPRPPSRGRGCCAAPTLREPMTVRAVLFDLDGTLADTEPSWLAAKAAVAARYGIAWSEDDGIASIGTATPVYSAEFVRRGSDADVEQIAAEITAEVARALAHDVAWRPGALDLLRRVVDAGLGTALVTMAYRPVAEAVARATGLPVFDVIVAGDDVVRSKPHPEPYLTALRLLGVDAGEALAVEDTVTGATSAEAAGIRTIVVPSLHDVPAAARRSILPSLASLSLDRL